MIALQVNQLTSLWIGFFLKHYPAPILEKVKCPVLATNGEKNIQVPAERDGRYFINIKTLCKYSLIHITAYHCSV
jgi:hypothetical protein